MAIPISKIIKKPILEGTEQLEKQQLGEIKQAKKKTFLEGQKTKQKLDEIAAQESTTMGDKPTFEKGSEAEARYNNILEKKRALYLKALNLKKQDELTSLIETNKAEGRSAKDTIYDLMSTQAGVGKTFENIEGITNAIETRISSGMYELKEGLRTKNFGLSQDRELGREVIRYLKDGADAIKNPKIKKEVEQIGEQWRTGSTTLRNMRNKYGGNIGEIEDWVIPQSHDALKIKKVPKENWKADIKEKLDIGRIEKEQGASIDEVLESAYNNITRRNIDVKPQGSKMLAKKQEHERVLHFKDGESIIQYNEKYGNPDVFATMDAHVRSQSNDIAQLKVFGTNPEATYEQLKILAKNEGLGDLKEKKMDAQWRVATGQVDGDNIVDQLDARVAAISGGFRAIQIASKLGSATISSIADIATMLISSNYRGLKSIRMFGKGLDILLQEALTKGKVAEDVKWANKLGLISEFANASLTNTRFAEMGTGWAQRRAENVIRASGLGAWTNSLRTAFNLELAAEFAENFTKSLDDVPFSSMLREYGIDEADWAKITKSKPRDIKGSKFLDMNEIYAIDEELGYKVSSLFTQEVNNFVVAPGYRTRLFTTWGAKKGTVAGETARNMMLFRSFTITMTMLHLNRFNRMSKTGKVAYGASVATSGVVFGTIALWAEDIVKGKTPRDVNRLAMVPEALAKSGGFGILGDLTLGEEKNRYGHSWLSMLGGVPAGTIEDIGKSANEMIEMGLGRQDPQKAAANMYNRAKNYIPGQNLWYTRLLIERSIGDAVSEMIDPNFRKKQRRKQKALRLRGQKKIETIFD